MIDCALLKNSFLFRFNLRAFGNNRLAPLNRDAVLAMIGRRPDGIEDRDWEKRVDQAAARLRGSKRLVESAAYDEVISFQNETRTRLMRVYANRSFIDKGLYCVKSDLVSQVEREIEQASNDLDALVAKFLEDYERARADAESVLGDQFNPDNYPDRESVRKRFGMAYRWIAFSVPEGLPPEIREREEAKLRETFEKAASAITGALWGEFSQFIAAIERKLETSEDGKRKIFKDTLFDDLTQFVGAFSNRNSFNDERLAGLVERAELIMAKVGGNNPDKAQKLRDQEGLRNQVKSAFASLKTEVEKAVAEVPDRAFNFEEE